MELANSLILIFSVVLLGLFCGRKEIFTQEQTTGFETYLFKIALPSYLFLSTMQSDFFDCINYPYICSYLLVFVILALLTIVLFRKETNADISVLGVTIMTAGYVNAAIYTMPVITFILGDPAAGILGNLIQVVIIQSCFLIFLSFAKHQEQNLRKKLFNVIRNPLVSLPILGIIFNCTDVILPEMLMNAVKTVSTGATTLALFSFGLMLGGIKFGKALFTKKVMMLTVLKNILHPIIAFIVGRYIFSLTEYWLYSLVIAASAPTAFVVYIISKQYNVIPQLVQKVVAASSIISLIFLIGVVCWIKNMT